MPGPVLPHPPALVPLLAVGPKPPQPEVTARSSNWQRAKAARAAAIASSLLRGRSTTMGWNPRLLITPLVPPSSHRLSRSPSCGTKCPPKEARRSPAHSLSQDT